LNGKRYLQIIHLIRGYNPKYIKNLHNLINTTNEQTKQNINRLIDAGNKLLQDWGAVGGWTK